MFTLATKKFGVWKEERRVNKLSYYLNSIQFVVALSIMAFVMFLTFMVVVKIRQEFFFIESAPVFLFKDKSIDSSFLIPERASAINIFVKKNENKAMKIYFEDGYDYLIPNESKEFVEYLEKRRRNIIYMAMVMRLNSEQNSRVKIWTEKNISFEDVRFLMKIFSQYGFDSFDFSVER